MANTQPVLVPAAAAGLLLACATVVAGPILPTAYPRVASGESNGLGWRAQSRIVGFNPTAGPSQDSRYYATGGDYNGVVAIVMEFGANAFICTGSLLSDRRSILTAAHCITDASLGLPDRTTAFFYDGSNPDYTVPFGPDSVAVDVSDYFIATGYTGEVIDQNDLAVIRLAEAAPDFARSYDLYEAADLTGQQFNVAGFGGRSTGGGTVGSDALPGVLRQGENRFEWYFDDPDFSGFWDGILNSTADYGRVVLSDFDSGLLANDAGCLVAFDIIGPGALTPKFCNLGLGPDEATIASGDSGGPQFINGLIASVTSFGLTFGVTLGDISAGLNYSFGEFGGYVPVAIHSSFIRSVMINTSVPEPGSLLLFGTGLFGIAWQHRRRAAPGARTPG